MIYVGLFTIYWLQYLLNCRVTNSQMHSLQHKVSLVGHQQSQLLIKSHDSYFWAKTFYCPGPVPDSVPDFWRMVWEQGSATIVMLTNLEEKGRVRTPIRDNPSLHTYTTHFIPSHSQILSSHSKISSNGHGRLSLISMRILGVTWDRLHVCDLYYLVLLKLKCHKYWPEEKRGVYGPIRVHVQEVLVLADYTTRTFSLQKEGSKEERIVTQFHFTSWPDHGVPLYPTGLLHFVRKVASFNPVNAGPMVVHCSAGVGRTGTFLTIISQLKKLQAENKVDIFGYVRSMRHQRCYMVQTEVILTLTFT